ncbi:hypothetical protein SynBMKMC1_02375 [Synechococcus sp. BMK-MC-1]|nr:hypothetical protein SynBMKMC1_02375 [Synechococcus sp. BMK-MC-1]
MYWVGDLSYVIEDFFDQGLYGLEGVHKTKDSYQLAIYSKMYGDGIFADSDGNSYAVDVANIGCVPVDAIDEISDLGYIVRFTAPFACRWIEDGGFICFGDLSIKTDPLSDAEYSESLNHQEVPSGGNSFEKTDDLFIRTSGVHIKLDPSELMNLILRNEDEVDTDTQLMMREIASYIELSDLLDYSDSSPQDQRFVIWMFHIVCHSGQEEFTEYFRGYYGTPDNEVHVTHLVEGKTRMELYAFLEKLDWDRIFSICRMHCDVDSVSRIFQSWAGLDYAAERARYTVEAWDRACRWPMVDGKYLPSE